MVMLSFCLSACLFACLSVCPPILAIHRPLRLELRDLIGTTLSKGKLPALYRTLINRIEGNYWHMKCLKSYMHSAWVEFSFRTNRIIEKESVDYGPLVQHEDTILRTSFFVDGL